LPLCGFSLPNRKLGTVKNLTVRIIGWPNPYSVTKNLETSRRNYKTLNNPRIKGAVSRTCCVSWGYVLRH